MAVNLSSPLQLKSFSLSKIELAENEEFETGSDVGSIGLSFKIGFVSAEDNPLIFKISLGVEIQDGEEGQSPYIGEIEAVGIFEIPDDSDENIYLVKYNGTSQLYGFIRSELYDLTLKFDQEAILLPSTNLVPLISKIDEAE